MDISDVCIRLIVPVRNRLPITQAFVVCLAEQEHQNFQVIFIDDGSTDGTTEYLKELDQRFTTLRSDKDLWWAGSINLAFRYLRNTSIQDTDLIMILNDDVVLEADFLTNGIQVAIENYDCLIGANFKEQEYGRLFQAGIKFDLRAMQFHVASDISEINTLSTKGLIVSYKNVKKIGKFRPILLPHYFSDYEWTFRAHKRGMHLVTSDIFFLTVYDTTTGMHDISQLVGFDYIRAFFSKRYVMNPIYLLAFAFLAGNFKSYRQILSILRRMIVDLGKCFIARYSRVRN